MFEFIVTGAYGKLFRLSVFVFWLMKLFLYFVWCIVVLQKLFMLLVSNFELIFRDFLVYKLSYILRLLLFSLCKILV